MTVCFVFHSSRVISIQYFRSIVNQNFVDSLLGVYIANFEVSQESDVYSQKQQNLCSCIIILETVRYVWVVAHIGELFFCFILC